jgi:hypothetical protein
MTLGELLTPVPRRRPRRPRPRPSKYSAAIYWLSRFSADTTRAPHHRACATEALASYVTRVSLSQATQVWLRDLCAHRSRTYKTHTPVDATAPGSAT